MLISSSASSRMVPHLVTRSGTTAVAVLALLLLALTLAFNARSPGQSNIPGDSKPETLEHSPRLAPDSLEHIKNSTLGFQKIFIINLPNRTDHRDAVALAASFTGLDVEYVDGVTAVDERTLPPGGIDQKLQQTHLGNWRAHLNAARTMVEQNIMSALILEDDADWDIRIKSQMQDFARAARLLVQPLPGTSDQFLDPTYPQPSAGQRQPQNFEVGRDHTSKPTTSPYGDLSRWDLFWLGHCGCRFPLASDINTPLGRAVIVNDTTVPEPQHVSMQFGDDELVNEYPAHTRVVSRARMNTCTLGYGLSLPGARRLLYELGIHKMTGTTDMMFRSICDGVDDRPIGTCLTVQPQLFQHHRPVGLKSTFSDISDHGTDYNEQAFTRNVRWSVRVNFPVLVSGRTDYIDLFKDGEQSNFGF